jgi:hypothetical protein
MGGIKCMINILTLYNFSNKINIFDCLNFKSKKKIITSHRPETSIIGNIRGGC